MPGNALCYPELSHPLVPVQLTRGRTRAPGVTRPASTGGMAAFSQTFRVAARGNPQEQYWVAEPGVTRYFD
jgi:hypothetical protein